MDLINRLHSLVRDASGQDLIEYALLAALLALATVAATQAAGQTILNTFWVRIAGMLDALPIG
jgi:Flp pilus assembly pilin Flp